MEYDHSRFGRGERIGALPLDLALLMVGTAARQAASPTARLQATLPAAVPDDPFAPADGAFNRPVASLMVRWRDT